MKTHSNSIFVNETDLVHSLVTGYACVDITSESGAVDYAKIEFVPAAAYIELQNELESSNKRILEAVSVATDTLKDLIAAHAENESLEAQLQTQTENMRALREFVENIADFNCFGIDDLICRAQDLITRTNR